MENGFAGSAKGHSAKNNAHGRWRNRGLNSFGLGEGTDLLICGAPFQCRTLVLVALGLLAVVIGIHRTRA